MGNRLRLLFVEYVGIFLPFLEAEEVVCFTVTIKLSIADVYIDIRR